VARKRLEVKGNAIAARRSVRYRSLGDEVAEDSPTMLYAAARRMQKRAASDLTLNCERIDTEIGTNSNGRKPGTKALARRRRL
jgi:hypothetical protein